MKTQIIRIPLLISLIVISLLACAHEATIAQKQSTETESTNPVNSAEFEEFIQLKDQIQEANIPELKTVALTKISGSDLPWTNTGLDLDKDDDITFLLGGGLDFGGGMVMQPGVAFWVGFGEKRPMFITGQNTSTTAAYHSGPMYFARSLTEWADKAGSLVTPPEHYQQVGGEIITMSLVWKGNPEQGLHKLIDAGITHELIAQELQRLKSPPSPPYDWKNMWLFGNNGVFREGNDNEDKRIDVFTHDDVGIIQKDVDVALAPNTNISWEWNVSKLPSALPEDTVPTHDYLSVAVEFDDGKDLTYMWSSGLELGHTFRCPLPRWAALETHHVVRNQPKELGKWLSENQNVYTDYKKYIGGKATKITRIWFIANTVFQKGYGVASFRNIKLKTKTGVIELM